MTLPRRPLGPVVAFLAVTLGALGAVACGSGGSGGSGGTDHGQVGPGGGGTARSGNGGSGGVLTVAAASSLAVPMRAIGAAFAAERPGTEVRFTFDSSAVLARQVGDGAPVDVLAAADAVSMAPLVAAGLVDAPTVFAHNRLAIAVKPGNPAGIRALTDLADARVGVVALCASEAPCGRYAGEVLDRAGVAIAPERITRGVNAGATFGAVAEGDAGAAIVYMTDVVAGRADRVDIPDDANVVAEYPVAVVRASPLRATAEDFVAFVRGPVGRSLLGEAGFEAP